MKVFSTTSENGIASYVVEGERIHKLHEEVINFLMEHKRGKRVKGDLANIDLKELLNRDYKFKGERLTKPYEPKEVWGVGISYFMARQRYSEENVAMIGGKTIYELIYNSSRPEIFFKATGNRCVGYGEPIAIRRDSKWTLPEPELVVIINSKAEILGYTIVDDVSARDIEAENPLYLPQSKTYYNCCAFGPFIVTEDEIGNPYNLNISLKIRRGGEIIYMGETNTSKLKRKIEEMVDFLMRDNPIPDGTLLMTGTGIVPGKDITLKQDDIVEIEIEKIGKLVTPVIKL